MDRLEPLYITTYEPYSLFEFGQEHTPLVDTKECEVTGDASKLRKPCAYLHGDAEELAGFDIPHLMHGNIEQFDADDQEIYLVLPGDDGPVMHKCYAYPTDKSNEWNGGCYYIELVGEEQEPDVSYE